MSELSNLDKGDFDIVDVIRQLAKIHEILQYILGALIIALVMRALHYI